MMHGRAANGALLRRFARLALLCFMLKWQGESMVGDMLVRWGGAEWNGLIAPLYA